MIEVERLGGFGGFGSPGSHLRSRGRIDPARLPAADREAVEALFAVGRRAGTSAPPAPDAFRYRLTRRTAVGVQTVEASETDVPSAVRECVVDELV